MMLASLLIGAPRWLMPATAVAVVILLLSWLAYRRAAVSPSTKVVCLLLKLCGVVLLAICLIEPLLSGVRPRPGANLFILLTDNSQSMTVQSGGRLRGDAIRDLMDKESPWRTRLQQDFDVRDYTFDSQLKHLAAPSDILLDGSASSLHTALGTLATRFEQRPIAGVLLLSDGNATDVIERSEYGFPVYPLIDDRAEAIRDVRIGSLAVTQTRFEASPMTVNATVVDEGFDGQQIVARIVDQQGAKVQEQTAVSQRGENLDFRFRFRPEDSGLSFYRLEVFPAALRGQFERGEAGEELTLANNSRWIIADRGGGPYRVLYVAGRPNWEFKFLRRALDEDDEIELTGLLRIAKKQPKFSFRDRGGVSDRNQLFEGFDGKDEEDVEAVDQPVLIRLGVEPDELRDGFPQDAEGLFQFDAILLDDVEASFFSTTQMLLMRKFVSQRGGGLMMLGGQESFIDGGYRKTPVGEMLPVYLNREHPTRDDEYRWQLTREGWLQDWARLRPTETAERKRLDEMTAFQTVNLADGLKPGASEMASLLPSRGESQPALATQRFGKGRTAALLVGDLWRSGMHQRDPEQQDLQQFWRQTVRWLVADVPQRVQMTSARNAGPTGPVTIEIAVRDEEFQPHDNADARVRVTTPQGNQIDLTAEPSTREAGLYAVDYWPREDGPYRATAEVASAGGEELDRKETGWTAEPAADEFRRLTTNREVLEDIAARSDGELVPVDQLETFVAGLPNRKVPVTETWIYPLWHQPWVLGLAVCCLCAEWGLRRWRGLP